MELPPDPYARRAPVGRDEAAAELEAQVEYARRRPVDRVC